jgi:hypothetical protein
MIWFKKKAADGKIKGQKKEGRIFDMHYLALNKQIKDRNLMKIHTTSIETQNQTINHDKLGIIGDYFSRLKVGSMLNRSGIIKIRVYCILVSPLSEMPGPAFLIKGLFNIF